MPALTLEAIRAWDRHDPLRHLREAFSLPPGVIYLDGNSLGPPPLATASRLAGLLADAWGTGLIRSWDTAGWMAQPARVGAKIARIVGAQPDEVIAADSTSVNLFKILAAAAALRPTRHVLLIEAGSFPTDRHIADGLAAMRPGLRIQAVPPADLAAAIGQDTAAVLLCDVHYRTGARHDMRAMTHAAHQAGALAVWDLSHSAGAVPVHLAEAGADMAVGCGYKFLNGGPGAPAFLFVARHLQATARSPLQGWIGHADPFGFSDIYHPAPGIERFLTGTPGILGLTALEAGVDQYLTADQPALFAKSAQMFHLFATRAAAQCPALELLTPTAPESRGSHISFRHPNASALIKSLIANGIIADYRPPDVLRFGLTPLYTRYEDIWIAVEAIVKEVESASF